MCTTEHVYYWACVLLSTCTTEYMYYWVCVLLSMCTTEYVYYWVHVLLSMCTTEYMYYWACVLLSTCTTEHVYYWVCVLLSMCTTEYVYYWARVLLSIKIYCWLIHLERELSFHSLQLQCTLLPIHHHFPPERKQIKWPVVQFKSYSIHWQYHLSDNLQQITITTDRNLCITRIVKWSVGIGVLGKCLLIARQSEGSTSNIILTLFNALFPNKQYTGIYNEKY